MTDAELIKTVAVEVMGYKKLPNGNYLTSGSTGMFASMSSGESFQPLTNANHWMMIVEKMRSKGWLFQITDYGDIEVKFANDIHKDFSVCDESIGHAVCLAALAAVRDD